MNTSLHFTNEKIGNEIYTFKVESNLHSPENNSRGKEEEPKSVKQISANSKKILENDENNIASTEDRKNRMN